MSKKNSTKQRVWDDINLVYVYVSTKDLKKQSKANSDSLIDLYKKFKSGKVHSEKFEDVIMNPSRTKEISKRKIKGKVKKKD